MRGGPPTPSPTRTPVVGPTSSVQPTPQAGGPSTQERWIIGFLAQRQSELVPAGSAPVVPPGGRDGGPISNAVVIYPDGSKQIADANGMFSPWQSSYAQRHQRLLRSSAQSQPQIIVIDPSAQNPPVYGTVAAYQSAAGLIQKSVQLTSASRISHAVRHLVGRQTNLVGVTLLPQQTSLLSTGGLYLTVLGTSADGNVVDLTGANIQWSDNDGTVTAFSNAVNAYYLPPQLGGGAVNDTITVAVSLANNPANVFYAAAPVSVLAPSSAATVNGSLTANGTPVSQGVAILAQAGPSQLFAPTLWLAQADTNGNYSMQVPATTSFGLGMGVPDQYSPTGTYGAFVAQQPNGTSSYRSPATGSADTLPLSIGSGAIPFSFTSAYDSGSVPSYVSFIRNAWYGTHEAVLQRIFEADSGVQPMLLQGAPTTLPSPAQPAAVGTGQLSRWCYQWQNLSGQTALVVVENTNQTCTQPGNEAYVITSNGGGSFSYVRYASNTVYPLSGTVDVISNSILVESGTWSQAVTQDTNGNITSDQVTDAGGFYDVNNQVLDSPVYTESLNYTYAMNGGLATSQFQNDTRVSNFDGSTVSVENATATQVAQFGPSGCQSGGAQACVTITGTEQADTDGSGTLNGSYSINDTFNGDGSAQLTFQSTASGDSSMIVLPMASGAVGNAGSCIVCAGNLGQIYDVDGVTDLGTVEIDNSQLVKAIIYDTPPGSNVLGPDQIDSFGFVL